MRNPFRIFTLILIFSASCTHLSKINESLMFYGGGEEIRLHPGNFYKIICRPGTKRSYYQYDTSRVEIVKNRMIFNSFNSEPHFELDTVVDVYTYSPHIGNYIADTTEVLLHNSRIKHTIYNINLFRSSVRVYHLDSLRQGQKVYYKIPNVDGSSGAVISLSMNNLHRDFKTEKEIKLRFYIDTMAANRKLFDEAVIGKNKLIWKVNGLENELNKTYWH